MKIAEEHRKQIQTYKDLGASDSMLIDLKTPEEIYDQEIEACQAEFDQVCNLGVDLMFKFQRKINTIKDNNGERWYFLTVRPPADIPFGIFRASCERYCDKWKHKWTECVYVYEQKGETEDTMGQGFHWHCRICTDKINYYNSHIKRDLEKIFTYVHPACIRVESVKSLERTIEYMSGDKKSDAKKPAVLMDSIWREAVGLPAEVKLITRQA